MGRRANKDCETQSEVKQLRFAIGFLEEGTAELGGAGAPEFEVLIEMEVESEETRLPTRMDDPKETSAKERPNHALTHLPYRTERAHCVGGRGKAADERRCPAEEPGVPVIALDHCLLGSGSTMW